MAKMKFGIDLGTTNSAISKIEKGKVKIMKSDVQKDTMPSCVSFNKKQIITVGERAYNQLKRDRLQSLKAKKSRDDNVFIEFKRTMGSDKKYTPSFMSKEYSSEELSSEILKKLKSFATDEEFQSVVVTVPAMFNDNQKSATAAAAKLAGFTQVKLLQEPIAAALAYSLDSTVTDENIIVFDFGGGTFDVALMKVEDGFFQVKDTDGDNWLGGKNLDNAIVQELLIPNLKENFSIDSYLDDDSLRDLLNNALKNYAEEAKIQLSFEDTYNVLSNLGDFPEDDDGEEIELDLDISQEDMKRVLAPVFQRAIDVCKKLLKRNNLDGSKIGSLILVGGPTYSPVLREMLKEQICEPETSIDPMTSVAIGAANYALKFDVDVKIVDINRDKTKIQIDLPNLKSHTNDTDLDVAIKLNKAKTEGDIPEKIFVEFVRADGGFSSGKNEFDETGEIIEIQLLEGKPNHFNIILYDDQGNKLDAEPADFTILPVDFGDAILPYNYGVEIYDRDKKKAVFSIIKGLEKNNTFPASGQKSGLKTLKDLRPESDDEIEVSIYQGPAEAQGTRAFNCDFVHTIKLKGSDVPKLLPKGSEINIFLDVKSDSDISANIEIPFLGLDLDYEFENQVQCGEEVNWVADTIAKINSEIDELKTSDKEVDSDKLNDIKNKLDNVQTNFEGNKTDYDTRMQSRAHLRECSRELDILENKSDWPTVEKKLKEGFYRLEENSNKSDDPGVKATVLEIKGQIEKIVNDEDAKTAREIIEKIADMNAELAQKEHGVKYWIGFIYYYDEEFDNQDWTNPSKARMIIDQGKREAVPNPDLERMKTIVYQLFQLLPGSDVTDPNTNILEGS